MALLIRTCVFIVVLVAWAGVGLIVWIPFLLRSIAVYTVGILRSAVTGRDAAHLREPLELAQTFYSRGFRNIIDNYEGQTPGHDPPRRDYEGAGRLFAEMVWATLFWGVFAVCAIVMGR
jgi:hypothetical protein